jgi:hypothetical protein
MYENLCSFQYYPRQLTLSVNLYQITKSIIAYQFITDKEVARLNDKPRDGLRNPIFPSRVGSNPISEEYLFSLARNQNELAKI